MPEIYLATGRQMPRPETETALLVDALAARGIGAQRRPWGEGTDWNRARLVVVRTPWDYFGRRREFLDWAGAVAAVTVLVNPVHVLEWNSHKGYLLELAAAGVPVVPTVLVPRDSSGEEQRAALAGYGTGGEVVVKPAVSVGAIGARRGPAGAPTTAAHLAQLAGEGDVLVQPYQPDIARVGEVSLMFFGDRFSHAIRKLPAAGDFRVQLHHGGSIEPHLPTADELAAAAAALRAAPGPLVYARVDLVSGTDGPRLMELEVIEPELFLGHVEGSAGRYAEHLSSLVG